jgi:hypothetical protein
VLRVVRLGDLVNEERKGLLTARARGRAKARGSTGVLFVRSTLYNMLHGHISEDRSKYSSINLRSILHAFYGSFKIK